jgi:hypothetical protein
MAVDPVIFRLEIFRMPLEMRPASSGVRGRRENEEIGKRKRSFGSNTVGFCNISHLPHTHYTLYVMLMSSLNSILSMIRRSDMVHRSLHQCSCHRTDPPYPLICPPSQSCYVPVRNNLMEVRRERRQGRT